MSLKLKALGLSLIAVMAVSAVAVMNASANGEGHFVSTGNTHTLIEGHVGQAGSAHTLHLTMHGFSGEIGCTTQTHTATTTTETVSSITVTPTYTGCTTTSNGEKVEVTVNGCTYTFTVAKSTVDTTEQTAHLLCPAGQRIEVHHPNCTVTINPQTTTTGLTYTTKLSATNKHEITMDVNIQFDIERHGVCGIFGTSGKGTLKGSVTVTGKNTNNEQVHVTAT
jgi:hypothetical protein